ncbi:MAG: prolipoprotein diacylglyceryl transferase [Planctomycetes bacterium]|nr:prolipoprotein diacylglyceryl transferase [Planctomycetota bacterium]
MLGVLNHPKLVWESFSTALLRWGEQGLIIYDKWVIGSGGFFAEYDKSGGEVILDVYYSAYLIAFIGVLGIMGHLRKTGWSKFQPYVAYDALLFAMAGVLIGAKTAYIFIYNPEFYFGEPPYGPTSTGDMLQRIFLNWSGMASHGAVAGVVLAVVVWRLTSKKPKLPVSRMADMGGLTAAFGAIWIRLANFMNGELYGRESSLPWAMRFPVRSGKGNSVKELNGELYEQIRLPEDPTARAEWIKHVNETAPGSLPPILDGQQFVRMKNPDAYQQGYELQVAGVDGPEFYAPDKLPDGLQNAWQSLVTTPRHPSQIYQLLLEGLILFLVLWWLKGRVKKSGLIAGGFLLGYPIARFIAEFFRQPDVQFQSKENPVGTILGFLSMGQILSIFMAVLGLAFIIHYRKHGFDIATMPLWPPSKKKSEEPESGEKESSSSEDEPVPEKKEDVNEPNSED